MSDEEEPEEEDRLIEPVSSESPEPPPPLGVSVSDSTKVNDKPQ
jgi:hypothetical protein